MLGSPCCPSLPLNGGADRLRPRLEVRSCAVAAMEGGVTVEFYF